jgi:hypothetical protein
MNRTSDLFERWHPYWDWECYQSGMWVNKRNQNTKILECADLLSNPDTCKEAMLLALSIYHKSAEQHLTKPVGRRPWLGQAACCVALGATEEETRMAWNTHMTRIAQDRANAIADALIFDWVMANA